MVVGTLTGECYNYIYEGFRNPVSVEEYVEIIAAAFKEHSFNVLKQYPPDLSTTDQRVVMTRMCTRWVFACGTRNFVNKAKYWNLQKPIPTFLYTFDFPLDFPGL